MLEISLKRNKKRLIEQSMTLSTSVGMNNYGRIQKGRDSLVLVFFFKVNIQTLQVAE